MNPKWPIFIITAWIVIALICGVIEGAYIGNGTGTEISILNILINPQIAVDQQTWGPLAWLAVPVAWITAFLQMLSFDFAQFHDEWEIFRWIFFLPIAISFAISLVLAFRGTSSG